MSGKSEREAKEAREQQKREWAKNGGKGEGESLWHLLKYLNLPTTPPTSRKHVKLLKFARADSRDKMLSKVAFYIPYLGHLSRPAGFEGITRHVPWCLGTKVPRVSLFTAKFVVSRCAFCKLWRDLGFPNHNVICRKNETENNSWLFKIAKEIAMVFLSGEGGRLWLLQVRPKKTFPGLSTSHVIKYWELIGERW